MLQNLGNLSDTEYLAMTKIISCRKPPGYWDTVQSRANRSGFGDDMDRYREFLRDCSSYYHCILVDIDGRKVSPANN